MGSFTSPTAADSIPPPTIQELGQTLRRGRHFSIKNQPPLPIRRNLVISEVTYSQEGIQESNNNGRAEHKFLGWLRDLIVMYKEDHNKNCPAFVILGSRWPPCQKAARNAEGYGGYSGCAADYILAKNNLIISNICPNIPSFFSFVGQVRSDY